MAHEGTKIHLFFEGHPQNQKTLIGFTSLSLVNSGEELMIPYFGISGTFRSPREEPVNERIAWRIFAGLLISAKRMYPDKTHIHLEVDHRNPARKTFYPMFRFSEIRESTDKNERTWVFMSRRLDDIS